MLSPILRVARSYGNDADVHKLMTRHLGILGTLTVSEQMCGIADVLDFSVKSETSLEKLVDATDGNNVLRQMKILHASATKIVADPRAALSEKLIALRLLSRGLGDDREPIRKLMVAFLTPQTLPTMCKRRS